MSNYRFFTGSYQDIIKVLTQKLLHKKRSLPPPFSILPTDLHSLSYSEIEPHSQSFQDLDLLTPDGMPIVWWLKYVKKKRTDRIYGPQLMKHLLSQQQWQTQVSHFFIAAQPAKVAQVSQTLATHFALSQYWVKSLGKNNRDQTQAMISAIKKYQPDVVWIGVGSPTQIDLAAEIKKKTQVRLIFCVGAAFDFITGEKKQAPVVLQQLGLEWLFRLVHEPRRLSKRYLVTIPTFLIKKLKQYIVH